MGNTNTQHLGGHLSRKDIDRLQRRYQRLAGNQRTVPITRFQGLMELAANPFITRIFELFDEDHDGSITLEEFTKALEYFGMLSNEEEQFKFAFKMYDTDGDGFISAEELYNILHTLVGASYSETHLEQIVHNTLLEFDKDNDQQLSFEEFKALLSTADLQSKFAMSL